MGAIDTILSPVIGHTNTTTAEACKCPVNRDHTTDEMMKRYWSEWWEFASVFIVLGLAIVGVVGMGVGKIFGWF